MMRKESWAVRVSRTTENGLDMRRPDADETAHGVEGQPWAEDSSDPEGEKLIERMVEVSLLDTLLNYRIATS